LKRCIPFFCIIAITVAWYAFTPSGSVRNAKIQYGQSEHFTQGEIDRATDVVLAQFRDFMGCELLRLYYDEDLSLKEAQYWAQSEWGLENAIEAENIIVLLSDFTVDSKGGDGSFNPNSTYTDWQWILYRQNAADTWQLHTWGY